MSDTLREGTLVQTLVYRRGHVVVWDPMTRIWRYRDDGTLAPPSGGPERPCTLCHEMPAGNGDDACLEDLPGVDAACCGHGVGTGYVLFSDGRWLRTQRLTIPPGRDPLFRPRVTWDRSGHWQLRLPVDMGPASSGWEAGRSGQPPSCVGRLLLRLPSCGLGGS